MDVSIKLNLIASLIPFEDLSIFRVCTKEECKYKLCGITVAPMIPMAMYNASLFGIEGKNPFINSAPFGLAKINSAIKAKPMVATRAKIIARSEEHTSELQSRQYLV